VGDVIVISYCRILSRDFKIDRGVTDPIIGIKAQPILREHGNVVQRCPHWQLDDGSRLFDSQIANRFFVTPACHVNHAASVFFDEQRMTEAIA